jgi:Ca2+/Na+ antiporter
MFALGRLLVIGFLVLSVVYICLSLYSRSVLRDKLEREWDEEIQQGDRETFVEAGLREYDGSLRRKLILGVYIVPLTVISVIIYLTNFH